MPRVLPLSLLASLLAGNAGAWTSPLMEALNRDARRLCPRSLAKLLREREPQVLEEVRRFPPSVGQAQAVDLQAGGLTPQTVAALDAEAARVIELLKAQRVSEGLVRLGGLLRIPADLADPVLTAGAEGYPPGVVREYYAFVEGNVDKIPVVLEDPPALKMARKDLPAYWQALLERSRAQSAVIRTELFQNGRLVDHRTIDFRSPVFGVASLSYSRAVTAIAATWLAVWREARGDLTRQPRPIEVAPRGAPPDGPPPPPPSTEGDE
ncbi:MAG TPA: hypothetical protein VL086_13820 [Candidatus Nitrosotalea sp.]|nr:hypothetical protein [Candidatus Nitrosotalea sp.]